MTSPEEPEEEKITEQELEDYLAQLSEETEREREICRTSGRRSR